MFHAKIKSIWLGFILYTQIFSYLPVSPLSLSFTFFSAFIIFPILGCSRSIHNENFLCCLFVSLQRRLIIPSFSSFSLFSLYYNNIYINNIFISWEVVHEEEEEVKEDE